MISFQDALSKILALPFSLQKTKKPIRDCLGLYLAADIRAVHSLPRWTNSAMDGYAFHWEDLEEGIQSFPITMTIPAGQTNELILERGCAARIMTGAPLPKGANTVIMQENTDRSTDGVISFLQKPSKGKGANVRHAGEEIDIQELVLPKGTRLDAASLALCAATGITELPVFVSPKIGIIATGDELKHPGEALEFGEIFASNTLSLELALQELGFTATDYGIARDNLPSTRKVFGTAIQECDIIISTGGVSVGDFDVVREALHELQLEMSFWKVKMKPGKPIAYGTLQGKSLFALPGNPVSCLMSFHQFLRPFLLQAVCHPKIFLPKIQVTLAQDIFPRGARLDFRRISLFEEDGELFAQETGSQSSAWLSSLVKADGLLPLAPNSSALPKGSSVTIQLLP